jgi:hypothetical protein
MFKRSLSVFLCLLIPGLVGSAAAQMDESLIGWWKFDEGAGTTAADSSGNGRDIELVSTTWEEGFAGSAVHFHGAGYGRDREFSSTGNAITLCTWVWHEAFIANRVERYVTVGPEIAVIRKEADGRLHFYITPGGAFSHAYAGNVLVEGQWQHIAGTWDGAAQRLYLNGEEVATLTPSGVLGTGTMFRLSSPDGEPLNGMLDEVRVYDRALSGREITAVMNPGGLVKAGKPVPADKATDVPRDVTLGWTPGESAVTHDAIRWVCCWARMSRAPHSIRRASLISRRPATGASTRSTAPLTSRSSRATSGAAQPNRSPMQSPTSSPAPTAIPTRVQGLRIPSTAPA